MTWRGFARSCAAAGTAGALAGCAMLLGIDDPYLATADAHGDVQDADGDASGDTYDEGHGEGGQTTPSDAGDRGDAVGGDAAGSDSGGTGTMGNDGGAVAPSCAGGGFGKNDCGPNGDEDCCASPPVTGGPFFRGYDAVYYLDQSYAATVSNFRLDRFEVTVGRFRAFMNALAGGWLPAPGSGKHAYLAGGGVNAGGETGWDGAWDEYFRDDSGSLDGPLLCGGDATWTTVPQANDTQAMNCVNWYEAYAFCIWDGGFLPTETEWNYAAAGGSDQRVFPWSVPPTSTTISCMYANFTPEAGSPSCAPGLTSVGKESPWGDSANNKWGQADMAGNAFEWGLDWYEDPYSATCVDCSELTEETGARVLRGGSYVHGMDFALTSFRGESEPAQPWVDVGWRCARAP